MGRPETAHGGAVGGSPRPTPWSSSLGVVAGRAFRGSSLTPSAGATPGGYREASPRNGSRIRQDPRPETRDQRVSDQEDGRGGEGNRQLRKRQVQRRQDDEPSQSEM